MFKLLRRTHGYLFPLFWAIIMFLTLLFGKRTSDLGDSIYFFPTVDSILCVSLMQFSINFLGAEYRFWPMRIVCSSDIRKIIKEKIAAIFIAKIILSIGLVVILTHRLSFEKETVVSNLFLILFNLINTLILSTWISLSNPMPFKKYFFGVDFSGVIHLIQFLFVMILVFNTSWFYVYSWNLIKDYAVLSLIGKTIFLIFYFTLFFTIGLKIFTKMMYKNRFSIMQMLSKTN
jgi:hypothetical protein